MEGSKREAKNINKRQNGARELSGKKDMGGRGRSEREKERGTNKEGRKHCNFYVGVKFSLKAKK